MVVDFAILKIEPCRAQGRDGGRGEGEVDRSIHRVKEGRLRVVGGGVSDGRSLFSVSKGD